MTFRFASVAMCFAGFTLLSTPGTAATIASCNATFTSCGISENILLQLPFFTVAGDVVVLDPNGTAVSDDFRIFNNIVNTGLGTGLGNMAFLYSSDDTPLPAPSTYSANAAFITEDPSGITAFVANGTTFLLSVPEPQTFRFVSLAVCAMAVVARRRFLHARKES